MPSLIHLIQNGTLRMIQEILHISSRCGGGKSREAIKKIVQLLASQQPVTETCLFASSSLQLSDQNYQFAKDEASQYPQSTIPVKKVDKDEAVTSVTREIKQLLTNGFTGVMFISHKALSLLPAQMLRNVYVVIDEVPQCLAGTLMVTHDPSSQNTAWEQHLQTTYTSDGNEVVTLVPNTHPQVEKIIRDIRSGFDKTLSSSVADLLEHLIIDDEPVYRGETTLDGQPCQMYQAVHYHHLKKLVENVSYLTVLSAQLKETLFGFICQDLLGLSIVNSSINASKNLEKKHKNKVRIIPILYKGDWSTALRKKTANEALLRKNGQPATSTQLVGLYAQEFAERILQSHDFIITLNKNEQMLESLQNRDIELTSTAAQGRNDLRHIDHAVYLASTNLTPFDNRIYRKFASDNNLSADKLLQSIKVERSYENAYQCVARTSIRNPPEVGKWHVIIVPDMQYAKYISRWFEPNCARISSWASYVTRTEYDRQVAKEERLETVTNILMQKKAKKGKLKDLIKAAGISRTTYDKYVAEFVLVLRVKGLLPSKPSKGRTLGDLYPTLRKTKL